MPRFLTADAVAAVLAHFPDDQFRSTSTELQAGFRRLAHDFPELFGQVSFGKVGAYVASPTIEAALDSLAASGFYSRYNKDLVTYQLEKGRLTSYYEQFLAPRFASVDISVDTLKDAALVLRDALNELRRSPNLELLLVT